VVSHPIVLQRRPARVGRRGDSAVARSEDTGVMGRHPRGRRPIRVDQWTIRLQYSEFGPV